MLQSKTARWSTGTALLCAALLAIAWFLVVSPRRAEASQVQAEVVSQQQQNDALSITVEQLKAEFIQLPITQASLEQIRSQMPPTEDLPGLLRTVEGLAGASGVSLLSFSPGTEQPLGAGGDVIPAAQASTGAVMTALPLTLTLSGAYFQVVSFLQQLQTSVPRAFLISGLQISKATSGASSGGVSVTLNAKVFSLPNAATSAAATGSDAVATPSGAAGSSTPLATPDVTVTPSASPAPTAPASPRSTPAVTSPKSTGAIALPQATGSPRW